MKRFPALLAGLMILVGGTPLLAQTWTFPSALQIQQALPFTAITFNAALLSCEYSAVSFTSSIPDVKITSPVISGYPACVGVGTITAGSTAGTATITATVTDLFGATYSIGTVASVTLAVNGTSSVAANGSLGTGAFTATVYDTEATPKPIPGVSVTFATSAGVSSPTSGGSFPASPGNAVTTSSVAGPTLGTANSPALTVNTVPGTFTFTATAAGVTSAAQTVTIIPGPAAAAILFQPTCRSSSRMPTGMPRRREP